MNSAARTILIVDDEPSNVVLLEHILRLAGYPNLISTSDPQHAETLIAGLNIDLILLDLHMPGISGLDILRRMGASAHTINSAPVLVLTADATRSVRETALSLGAKDFVTKPFDNTEVLLRVKNLLETRTLHLELSEHNRRLADEVRKQTGELRESVRRLEGAHIDLRTSQDETVAKLAIAAEFRDRETARHIHRMSQYCGLLGRRAGQSPEETELLRVASEMHDIGKIGVPDNVLLKPGALTAEERLVMERHPEIGHRILADSESKLLQLAATIAIAHHERIDGTGYPYGLSEEDIPFEARVAAIADVFDALTTDRVYREAIELEPALEIMHEGRGTQFDSNLLDSFLASLDSVLAIKEGRPSLADAEMAHLYVA